MGVMITYQSKLGEESLQRDIIGYVSFLVAPEDLMLHRDCWGISADSGKSRGKPIKSGGCSKQIEKGPVYYTISPLIGGWILNPPTTSEISQFFFWGSDCLVARRRPLISLTSIGSDFMTAWPPVMVLATLRLVSMDSNQPSKGYLCGSIVTMAVITLFHTGLEHKQRTPESK